MMKFIATAATATMIASGAAACEYGNVTVTINTEAPQYNEVACAAAIKAVRFFEDLGYTDAMTLTLNVQDEVLTYVYDTEAGAFTDKSIRIFGEFNAHEHTTTVSSFGTDYMNERTAWLTDPADMKSGIAVDLDVWASVVTHEVAHQVIQNLWEARNPMLVKNGVFVGHGLHEYAAYYVQIATMDEDDRAEVLAMYPDATAFQWPESANGIAHFMHPHKFGVRAYLTQNTDWIKDVIEGRMVSFEAGM